jgi:shikimate dehydrogenase
LARNLEKAKLLETDFKVQIEEFSSEKSYRDFDILVNTMPLGMKGKAEDETPANAKQLEGLKLVYDLVYTPFQTRLLSEADKAGVPKIGGLAMLIAQAMAQQKIWTGIDAPMKEMSAAALQRLS